MAVKAKIKVKLTGKDAKDMAQDPRVALAVSKAQISAKIPGPEGANYVSRNDLHLDTGTSSGVNRASKHVSYKPRPGIQGESTATPELKGTEMSQVNKPETGSKINLKPEGFGPSYVGEGLITVEPVKRELNLVERARQANNRTRDMRTNLGRGKPSVPSTDAGPQTPTRWNTFTLLKFQRSQLSRCLEDPHHAIIFEWRQPRKRMKQQTELKKASWVSTTYQRVPWLRVKYGQRILPPNQQSSNNHFADDLVLKLRSEPIKYSSAWSLNVGSDSVEESNAKR
jgi:hypothetical protein